MHIRGGAKQMGGIPMTADPKAGVHMRAEQLRRYGLLTSGAGVAFGVLTIIAWLLLTQARVEATSIDEVRARLESGGSLAAEIAALYVLPFAVIAFLWFIVALREWIHGTEVRRNRLQSGVQLVSGVVFTAVFLVGDGALATSVIVAELGDRTISIDALVTISAFGTSLVSILGVRMAAMFILSTASLGLTTQVLPRWFAFLSYAFGIVLMLTPVVATWLILAFPLWVIALSVLLGYHIERLRRGQVPGFAERHGVELIEGA